MKLFTENLELLFQHMRHEDDSMIKEVEIEVWCMARGQHITKAYIQRLRSGQSENPSFDKIKALADFFGVHPGFFFDEHRSDDSYKEYLNNEEASWGSSSIAARARASETTPEIKRTLVDIAQAIEAIHKNIETKESRKNGGDRQKNENSEK